VSSNPRHLDQAPEEVVVTLRAYVRSVTEAYGDQLEGVVLYGSAARGDFFPGRSNVNTLLLLKDCGRPLLARYARLHRRWGREQIVVPLFLTQDDLQAMAAAYPLEIWDIQSHHRVLVGHDPFLGLHVDQGKFLEIIERELRGHLVRTNQRFVEGDATVEAASVLLPLAITSVLPYLRATQAVLGRTVGLSGELVLKDVEAALGDIDLRGLIDAWNLKRGVVTPGPAEVPHLFDRYLSALRLLLTSIARLKHERRF
jgi:hypothetical protein